VLLLLTSLLFLLGVQDSRFTVERELFNADQFPGPQGEWLAKGDTSEFKWSDSHIELSQKDITDNRESYIFRPIALAGPSTTPIDTNEVDSSDETSNRRSGLLRIRGEIEVVNESKQQAGSLDRSRQAGFMVWFLDGEGVVIKYTTIKSFPAYSANLYLPDRTILLPEEVQSLYLVFMLRDSDASFKITSMSASLVNESQLFNYTSYLLWAAYCLFLCCCIWLIVGSKGIIVAAGLSIIVALLILGVVIPEAWRFEFSQPLHRMILAKTSWMNLHVDISVLIFKIGHVLAFCCLTVYLLLFQQKHGHFLGCLLVGLALFAVSTEAIQLYRYDRETRITDVLLNLVGVGLGYLIYLSLSRLVSRQRTVS